MGKLILSSHLLGTLIKPDNAASLIVLFCASFELIVFILLLILQYLFILHICHFARIYVVGLYSPLLKPKRIWHDTTIKSAREANQLGLSTGVKRESGRGQRVMVLGLGGEEGWIHYEVIKR